MPVEFGKPMKKDSKIESDNAKDNDVKKEFTLSIETGIRGGSIALLKHTTVIDSRLGQSEISRSEDVLEGIRSILLENNIEKTQIKLIVFSKGPGSFTGIRIGVVLAQGLSKSLGCDYLGLSVLEAMADNVQAGKKVIAAVNFGKNQVCWQFLRVGATSESRNLRLPEPRISAALSFIQEIEYYEFDYLILQNHLYNNLLHSITKSVISNRLHVNATDNLAAMLGKYAEKPENKNQLNQREERVKPIYVENLQK